MPSRFSTSQNSRPQRIADGGDNRILTIAGDHGRRRRIAKAGFTRIGNELDDDVFRRINPAQRRLEGFFQRDADFSDLDFTDFHASLPIHSCLR